MTSPGPAACAPFVAPDILTTVYEFPESVLMDVLERLFEHHFQIPVEQIKPLQGQLGGSGRAIFRLSGGGSSAIGIVYPVREENLAFVEFSRHFRRHGLPVPQIYSQDLEKGAYLEEDLGDLT